MSDLLRVGSLCSGYEGIGLGLKLVFGEVSHEWFVEFDAAPSKILAHHWPTVPNYGDVKHTDWSAVPPIDLLTAGYPCQPFSHAGLRKGADDPRHLWPGVERAISVLRPGLVLLENVRGHVSLGLDAVLGDLAALGYDATWGVVRASDAGAPHSRARIFILATDTRGEAQQQRAGLRASGQGDVWRGRSVHDRPQDAASDADQQGSQGGEPARRRKLPARGAVADADRAGRGGVTQLHSDAPARLNGEHRGHPDGRGDGTDWGAYTSAVRRWEAVTGRPAPRPTEPARGGTERLSPQFVEWMMGLPAGHVTDVPGLARNAQLKALGNGVVPQQAALAMRTLLPLAVAA